jgi:hypothetical protein
MTVEKVIPDAACHAWPQRPSQNASQRPLIGSLCDHLLPPGEGVWRLDTAVFGGNPDVKSKAAHAAEVPNLDMAMPAEEPSTAPTADITRAFSDQIASYPAAAK